MVDDLFPEDLPRLLGLLAHVDLYLQDEVEIALHPTLTRVWSRAGRSGQRLVQTPGTNVKQYGFGLVDWRDGHLDWAVARSRQRGRIEWLWRSLRRTVTHTHRRQTWRSCLPTPIAGPTRSPRPRCQNVGSGTTSASREHPMQAISEVRPFRIDIPQAALDDLRDRLDRVRWTEELPGAGWDYGVPVAHVKELVAYWRDGYDWRAWEARLNQHPQFTTEIDGQRVHLLHVRSPEPDALPLLLSHGWPGSVAEFLDVIGPLADPRAHGRDPAIAFDLVIPSLPGYAFSGPTTQRGWDTRRVARAWAELMRRLGYGRYGAVGNDWGTYVSHELGRAAPDRVVGVHVTQLFSLPTGAPGELEGLSADEQAAMENLRWVGETFGTYHQLQAQQPQTLAHALADSPVGLLGWHCQIYRGGLDPDFVLTNVTIHWLTGTVASAMRLYYEVEKAGRPTGPTTVPVGLAQFSHDFQAIRRFAERDHASIVSWNVYDRPGHYAAHQSPELLVGDIRQFFGKLRRQPA